MGNSTKCRASIVTWLAKCKECVPSPKLYTKMNNCGALYFPLKEMQSRELLYACEVFAAFMLGVYTF